MFTIIHSVVCERDFLKFRVITECKPSFTTATSMIFKSESYKSETPLVEGYHNSINWDLLSLLKDFSKDKRVGCRVEEETTIHKLFYMTVMKDLFTNDSNEISQRALEEHRRIINSLKAKDDES